MGGPGMSLGRWVLACSALVLACFPAAQAQAAQPVCKLALHATVDLSIDASGAVLVPVKLEGHDVWMYLALAHGMPMIFSNVADELGLAGSASPQARLGVGGQVDWMLKLPHMKVGGADFTGWEFRVFPVEGEGYGTYAGLPVAGTITSQFLREVDVELNLAERRMNIFTPTTCKGGALYWGGGYTALPMLDDDSGLIAFATELDGQRIETSLDTSSPHSRISSAASAQFFGFDTGDRAMKLAAKGLVVSNANVEADLAPSACELTPQAQRSDAIGYASCTNATPFSIGTNVLKHFRVYIAPKEEAIYISRVSAP